MADSIECDLNGCVGSSQFYIYPEGFELAGFFVCAHDADETKRRIGGIAGAFGAKVFVVKISDLMPLQLLAIKAKREGKA